MRSEDGPGALAFSLDPCGADALLSHAGVVKRWECDRNDHWNVQFYVRAFQVASEVLAAATTGDNPGAASSPVRHHRFYSEIFCPEPMRIGSSRIADGVMAGWVVHMMEAGSEGRLAATAIERPAYDARLLPARAAADVAKALPRGLASGAHGAGEDGARTPLGVVRPAETDHTGALESHALVALSSTASHTLLNRLGLTAAWINETNCNRMAVEMKVTHNAPSRAGDFLDALSRVSDVGTRHFAIRHEIVDAMTGARRASVEQLMLVVDLETRRPVAVPDFIRAGSVE